MKTQGYAANNLYKINQKEVAYEIKQVKINETAQGVSYVQCKAVQASLVLLRKKNEQNRQ